MKGSKMQALFFLILIWLVYLAVELPKIWRQNIPLKLKLLLSLCLLPWVVLGGSILYAAGE